MSNTHSADSAFNYRPYPDQTIKPNHRNRLNLPTIHRVRYLVQIDHRYSKRTAISLFVETTRKTAYGEGKFTDQSIDMISIRRV